MNELRILDLNNALLEGSKSFKTLENISIEFDDNNNCIYSCDGEHVIIQAKYKEKDVILIINLKRESQDIEKCNSSIERLFIDTTTYKSELRVINVRDEEVFVDITMVDDSAIELISLITPNAPDDSHNRNIISEFINFLITINKERIIINGFSFDQCFILDGKLRIYPLNSSDIISVGDTETELICSFNNFTIKMLSELLVNIYTRDISYSNIVYKIEQYEYYNTTEFTNSIRTNIDSTGSYFSNITKLIDKSCRGDIINILDIPSEDISIVQGSYQENRVAAYDNTLSKWGYLNLKGETAIPFIYDQVNGFYEDVAVVKKGDFYGSINRRGEQLLDFCFKSLSWQGKNNIYIFKKESFFGIIDRNGNILVSERYLSIGNFNDGCAIVQSQENALFGAINSLGEVIIEPIYDSISPFRNMRTTAKKGCKSIVLDIFGDKI